MLPEFSFPTVMYGIKILLCAFVCGFTLTLMMPYEVALSVSLDDGAGSLFLFVGNTCTRDLFVHEPDLQLVQTERFFQMHLVHMRSRVVDGPALGRQANLRLMDAAARTAHQHHVGQSLKPIIRRVKPLAVAGVLRQHVRHLLGLHPRLGFVARQVCRQQHGEIPAAGQRTGLHAGRAQFLAGFGMGQHAGRRAEERQHREKQNDFLTVHGMAGLFSKAGSTAIFSSQRETRNAQPTATANVMNPKSVSTAWPAFCPKTSATAMVKHSRTTLPNTASGAATSIITARFQGDLKFTKP